MIICICLNCSYFSVANQVEKHAASIGWKCLQWSERALTMDQADPKITCYLFSLEYVADSEIDQYINSRSGCSRISKVDEYYGIFPFASISFSSDRENLVSLLRQMLQNQLGLRSDSTCHFPIQNEVASLALPLFRIPRQQPRNEINEITWLNHDILILNCNRRPVSVHEMLNPCTINAISICD